MSEKPIVNCHTHIFTSDDVPRYIAKQFIPWPFYYLTNLKWIIRIYKFYRDKVRYFFQSILTLRKKILTKIRASVWTDYLFQGIFVFALINIIGFILQFFDERVPSTGIVIVDQIKVFLRENIWVFRDHSLAFKLVFTLTACFMSKYARNITWSLLKLVFKPLSNLPSSDFMKFVGRYFHIVRFAVYVQQKRIFDKMHKLYEQDAKFVILPMDMEYMDAGKPNRPYLQQLHTLMNLNLSDKIKNRFLPFVFADPRRMKDPKGGESIFVQKSQDAKREHLVITSKPYFDWDLDEEGKVILKDSWIKRCLEQQLENQVKFRGIKIYPALGYYPFDETLLPLWLYCQQNNIPITSHCIIGTVFYRGRAKAEWFKHPVFRNEYKRKDENGVVIDTRTEMLSIHEKNNFRLQKNFTHPLNYLILLEPSLLRTYIHECVSDLKIRKAFGFMGVNEPLGVDLTDLKINLAHYGGSEEWLHYWESDRQEQSQEIEERPDMGYEFFKKRGSDNYLKEIGWNRITKLWEQNIDWYTIISSMMLQYKNVYADISYTLHNKETMPLLYRTLQNKTIGPSGYSLSQKVLFGTDFYVVRNHKTEKQLFAELEYHLEEDMMQALAIDNPHRFLNL